MSLGVNVTLNVWPLPAVRIVPSATLYASEPPTADVASNWALLNAVPYVIVLGADQVIVGVAFDIHRRHGTRVVDRVRRCQGHGQGLMRTGTQDRSRLLVVKVAWLPLTAAVPSEVLPSMNVAVPPADKPAIAGISGLMP